MTGAPSPDGVLLLRMSSLGDVILATAAASRVRQVAPDTPVAFVTRAPFAPVLFRHPDIDRVIVLGAPGRERRNVWNLAGTLRRERWSGIIDLHASLRSRLLSALVRPPKVTRYRNEWMARRLLVQAPRVARRLGMAPAPYRVVQAYVDAVDRHFGHESGGVALLPSIHLAPAEIGWASREMERLGVRPGSVALCPGAKHNTKRWPVEYYAETIDRLAVRSQPVVPVFLSSSPDDGLLEAALRRAVRRPEAIRLIRQPIRRAAALLSRCRSVVTNDSGLMHLSAALGIPVVALFGPTVGEFGFFPAGPGHQVLERALPCRPCSLHGGQVCPEKHFRCLKEIPPEDVLLALEKIDRRKSGRGVV
jgi:lipopolysaccharide heptosyltransferase II